MIAKEIDKLVDEYMENEHKSETSNVKIIKASGICTKCGLGLLKQEVKRGSCGVCYSKTIGYQITNGISD